MRTYLFIDLTVYLKTKYIYIFKIMKIYTKNIYYLFFFVFTLVVDV